MPPLGAGLVVCGGCACRPPGRAASPTSPSASSGPRVVRWGGAVAPPPRPFDDGCLAARPGLPSGARCPLTLLALHRLAGEEVVKSWVEELVEVVNFFLLPPLLGVDALAAAALGAVGADRGALDVAAVGEGEDALLLLDEILNVDLVLDVLISVLRSSPYLSRMAISSSFRTPLSMVSLESSSTK